MESEKELDPGGRAGSLREQRDVTVRTLKVPPAVSLVWLELRLRGFSAKSQVLARVISPAAHNGK